MIAVSDWLGRAARTAPHRLALIPDPGQKISAGQMPDTAWTFAMLDTHVTDYAGRLAAAGLRADQRVGWWGLSATNGVIVLLALARLGAVAVPFNTRLRPDELAYQIDTVGCAVVLTDDERLDLPISSTGLRITDLPSPLAYAAVPPYAGRIQGILFTSGTTGRPKAAPITFGAYAANAAATEARLGRADDDRWLLGLPLYHVGGLAMLFRAMQHATGLVAYDLRGGFDAAHMAALLTDPTLAVTHVSLVPTMLYRLLDHGFSAPPHLKCILLGGAAAGVDLVRRALDRGLPVAPTYGLTEATSQVATLTPARAAHKPGSVGRPLDGVSVSIIREVGQPAATAEIGEIVVRGKTVFAGYLAPPGGVQPIRDGALYTGDLGYLDADGDLWIVQRRSDLIVTGGENVYPAEVEAALRAHPAIADACVVGIPDAEWGQRVAAAVVTRHSYPFDEAAVTAFVRERLAGYKQPRLYRVVAALPQTANGKVERRTVAALFTQ